MFGRWLLRRAAGKYGRRLPHQLLLDYGHKEHYTYRQLQHSIKAAGLNPRYAVFAFARYLPQAEFNSLRFTMDVSLAYNEALAMFIDAEPIHATSHAADWPSHKIQ